MFPAGLHDVWFRQRYVSHVLRLSVVSLVLVAATVEADADRFRLRLSDLMMDSDVDGLAAMMGPSFTNGGLFFTEPACVRFNKSGTITGDSRQALWRCLLDRGHSRLDSLRSRDHVWIMDGMGAEGAYHLYQLKVKDGKLLTIESAAANDTDRKLPTLGGLHPRVPVTLSAATKAAVKKRPERVVGFVQQPAGVVDVTHKVCFDADGKVKNHRVIAASDVPSFDRETAAAIDAHKKLEPYLVDGKPQPACLLIRFGYAADDPSYR